MVGASAVTQLAAFLRPVGGLIGTYAAYTYLAPFDFAGQDFLGMVWRLIAAGLFLVACYGLIIAALWGLAGRPEGAEAYVIRTMRRRRA